MRLTILGGSSPFLAELFLQWRRHPAACPDTLVLHGRAADALAANQAFAAAMLPDRRVLVTTRTEEALEGADIVFHQVRYGGLEGRGSDEAYCRRRGLPADETLGPGGFRAALRMRDGLIGVAAAIATRAPDALVINFTNPLSLSTSLLAHAGVSRVCGLCELPDATAALLESAVGEPLRWDYVGFNHRGFLFDVVRAADPGADDVLATWPEDQIGGIPTATVRRLRALPTKYFGLFLDRTPISRYGRAAELARIRRRVLLQLKADPLEVPAALAERHQDWWLKAVIPFLLAIRSAEPRLLTVNLPDREGFTREVRAMVGAHRIAAMTPGRHPATLDPWLRAFERHERASLAALVSPTRGRIRAALRADPLRADPVRAEPLPA